MPAPKKPNTARATEKAAEARNRERDQRDAERLRDRGWTVTPPDVLEAEQRRPRPARSTKSKETPT